MRVRGQVHHEPISGLARRVNLDSGSATLGTTRVNSDLHSAMSSRKCCQSPPGAGSCALKCCREERPSLQQASSARRTSCVSVTLRQDPSHSSWPSCSWRSSMRCMAKLRAATLCLSSTNNLCLSSTSVSFLRKRSIMPHLLGDGDGRTRSLRRCPLSILPTFAAMLDAPPHLYSSDVGCASHFKPTAPCTWRRRPPRSAAAHPAFVTLRPSAADPNRSVFCSLHLLSTCHSAVSC